MTKVALYPYRLPMIWFECGHKRVEEILAEDGRPARITRKEYKAIKSRHYLKLREAKLRRRKADRTRKGRQATSPTGSGQGEEEIKV